MASYHSIAADLELMMERWDDVAGWLTDYSDPQTLQESTGISAEEATEIAREAEEALEQLISTAEEHLTAVQQAQEEAQHELERLRGRIDSVPAD